MVSDSLRPLFNTYYLTMKRFVSLVFVFCISLMAVHAQPGFGDAQLFNENWLFCLSDDNKYSEVRYNDAQWRVLSLPHDWSIEGTPSQDLASCTGYLPGGIAWYRKHFKIDDKQSRHFIYFEGVYNRSEVYLNGHLLGKRPNGYVSFMYDLTPYLCSGDNVIAVRVDHSKYADSRWYTGSGIYRNVWMVASGDTHIAQWGVGYQAKNITAEHSDLDVTVEVEGADKLKKLSARATLTDKDGKTVMTTTSKDLSDSSFRLSSSVASPHLWSISDPYLYTLHVELLADDKVIDKSMCRVGIRSLQFDPDKGFALNQEWMKVKGVCIHHDAGVLGAAVPRSVWHRRLLMLKEMGANALRMSHNMQSPDVYDLADELGFLVMDEGSDEWEFPKRKWLQGWNKGTPGYDGTYDFFEEWIDRDIADMVRRDRNHPSVFLWSVGNEVDYPNDPYSHPVLDGDQAGISQPMYGGYKKDAPRAERIGTIAKRLATIIRSIDPSRPVTGAMAGVVMSNQTEYPDAIDVCGYNYTENRYITDHELYPKRVIYGSETSTNLNSWAAVRDNPHIFGHFVWTGYEYLGESGAWPSRGLGTGLIDFAGFIKPRGRFFQSLWSTKPMAYIGTQPIRAWGGNGNNGGNRRGGRMNLSPDAQDSWNYSEGQNVRVLCYTNQPFARLVLNGKEVGERKAYDAATGIISWEVPYEAGTLRVEALDNEGKVTATYDVSTYGEASKLQLIPANMPVDEPSSLLHLLIELVDANGHRVLSARNDVTIEVISGGHLLGLENANNGDMSAPKQSHRNANRGRLLAYIQRNDTNSKVKVRVTAEGLPAQEVEF